MTWNLIKTTASDRQKGLLGSVEVQCNKCDVSSEVFELRKGKEEGIDFPCDKDAVKFFFDQIEEQLKQEGWEFGEKTAYCTKCRRGARSRDPSPPR